MPTTTIQPAATGPVQALPQPQSGRPLNVVMVDEELPFPATSGKRLRTLNLTLRLANRHKITFICHRHADNAETQRARAFFLEQGIRTVVVDRPVPRKSGLGFYARLAANMLSSLPYTVTSHNSGILRRALRDYAAQHPVDLWHCEWTPYAQALLDVAGAPRVIMAHNIEAQLWQRYCDHESNAFKRWFMRRQLWKFLRFEFRTFSTAQTTVTVSQEDADLARFALSAERVEVVDNGVDADYFQPSGSPRQAETLLFLGSLDWRPNLDAVQQLLTVVWPVVRIQRPRVKLQIVGRNPPHWLARQIASMPGVELHASVPDVRPFLTSCSLLVVPLRIAGGTRLKILEALACETPVVSTRVGAEGLRLEAGEHLAVVDNVEQMAGAVLEALVEPGLAQAQAWRGRQVVLEHHGWDMLADRLDSVWQSCVACPATETRT
jgi:glycosyltransferase involved in cell wall biosynthesis